MSEPFNHPIPKLVLVSLSLLVVVAAVLAGSSSTAALSVYNTDWDGTSELRSMAGTDSEVIVARDTDTYGTVSANSTIAFVLSPDSAYSPTELAQVSKYVRDGGTLVVAGDFGPHTNKILRVIGASARLDGRPLRDPRSNYRTPTMPVTSPTPNASFWHAVESLTLNYGTAVQPNGATVLFNTSEYAYLDTDGNGRLGPNEELTSYPVVTAEPLGSGRVIVVSDSSVFINAMLEPERNRPFVAALLSENDRVLFDYSHMKGLPPLVGLLLVVRSSAWLKLVAGVVAVSAVGIWSRETDFVSATLRPLQRSNRPSIDTRPTQAQLVAYLQRRHPDWDRERIERVAAALQRHREEYR